MYAGLVAPFGGRRRRHSRRHSVAGRRRHSVRRHSMRRHSMKSVEGGRRRRHHSIMHMRKHKRAMGLMHHRKRGGFWGPLAATAIGSLAGPVFDTIKGLFSGRGASHHGGRRHSMRRHSMGGRRHRLVKGSPAARAFMAKIRARRHGGAMMMPSSTGYMGGKRLRGGAILTPGPLL